ncbi:MAG: TIM barrel protein [Candidatus Pacearchaeota archaeon]
MIIKFGPAGIGGFKEAQEFLERYNKVGIKCAEIPFTYKVWLDNSQAKKIGEIAKKFQVELTIHAPYYINLNSRDFKKVQASMQRILDCCERAHYLQAKYVVFHAAYYEDINPEKVFQIVKKRILEMERIIKKNEWHVVLAPETTGKASQFGSLEELLQLVKETKCFFCVDFAHMLARKQKINYNEIFEKIKKANIDNLHCHFSGIEFTNKGEKRHVTTSEKAWRDLLSAFKKNKISANIINESPTPVEDSLLGLKIWNSLK